MNSWERTRCLCEVYETCSFQNSLGSFGWPCFGVAADVQIAMWLMCQPGAVVRDNEGLAFTNSYRGCPGITASLQNLAQWRTITSRHTISLGLGLRVPHCMERSDNTEVTNESPLLVEGGWNRRWTLQPDATKSLALGAQCNSECRFSYHINILEIYKISPSRYLACFGHRQFFTSLAT